MNDKENKDKTMKEFVEETKRAFQQPVREEDGSMKSEFLYKKYEWIYIFIVLTASLIGFGRPFWSYSSATIPILENTLFSDNGINTFNFSGLNLLPYFIIFFIVIALLSLTAIIARKQRMGAAGGIIILSIVLLGYCTEKMIEPTVESIYESHTAYNCLVQNEPEKAKEISFGNDKGVIEFGENNEYVVTYNSQSAVLFVEGDGECLEY